MRARNVDAVLEMVGAEHILDWARIAEASGGDAEAYVLGKKTGRNVYRERSHVRTGRHEAYICPPDVSGIIEQPLLAQVGLGRDRAVGCSSCTASPV